MKKTKKITNLIAGRKSIYLKTVWWVCIVSCFYIITYIFSNKDMVQNYCPLFNDWGLISLFIFAIGIFFGASFGLKWKGKEELDGAINIFKRPIRNYWITYSLYTLIILSAIILLSTIFSSGKPSKLIADFFADPPGGFFGFITGVGTLVGTLIAIQTIFEMKHTITSYPQLLERLTEMIEKATDKEGTKIVCYFPLPGFWQVNSPELRNSFKNRITLPNRKIQMICVEELDHIKLLLTIAKIRSNENSKVKKITPTKLLMFHQESESMLVNFKDLKSGGFNEVPIRLPLEKMPPFYFFVSTNRAIIVTPARLPSTYKSKDELKLAEFENMCQEIQNQIHLNGHKCSIKDDESINEREYESYFQSNFIDNLNNELTKVDKSVSTARSITEYAHVSTLGFETSDRATIDLLQSLFIEYKLLSKDVDKKANVSLTKKEVILNNYEN